MKGRHSPLLGAAVGLLIALPWINPYAGGPSATLQPWLFSLLLATLLWALVSPRPGLCAALLALWLTLEVARAAVTRAALEPELLTLFGAGVIIALMATVAADVVARRPALVAVMTSALLAAALISSLIALCQYFGLAPDFAPLMSVTAPGEAFANLRQRNQLASLTGIGVAALLWWTPRFRPGYAVAAISLLAAANAATASRTGLLQMVMLVLFMGAWPEPARRSRLGVCLAGGLAYLVAALLLPSLLETVTGTAAETIWRRVTQGEGCGSRAVLWSNVLHLIAQKPWLGWGWGELDYAHYITLYDGPRFCDILDNAHNLPLHLAVELGIPAALLVCGALGWVVVRGRPWRETDPTRQFAWCVLAVILLHSMLEYPLWYGPFQMAFGLCLGLLWRAPGRSAAGSIAAGLLPRAVQRSLAAALVAAIAYAAWDYHRVGQVYLPAQARAAAYRDDTLARIGDSWLFRNQLHFAELTTTPLSRDNAQWTLERATALLHYSPEPRVIEKVIESAVILGRDDLARAHLERYRAAFAADHAQWAASPADALARNTP